MSAADLVLLKGRGLAFVRCFVVLVSITASIFGCESSDGDDIERDWKSRACPYTIEVLTGKTQDGLALFHFDNLLQKPKDKSNMASEPESQIPDGGAPTSGDAGTRLGSIIPMASQTPEIEQSEFECRAPSEELKHVIWAQGAPAVRVSIRRVQADDWIKYMANQSSPFGVLELEKDYLIGLGRQKIEIDLRPYLRKKFGHFVIEAKLVGGREQCLRTCWFEVTNIALDAFDTGKIEFFTTGLLDGKPLAGVEIKAPPLGATTVSDMNGRATVEYENGPQTISWVASAGQDSCVLTHFSPAGSEPPGRDCEWYVVSDRFQYSPGQRVIVRGLLRRTKYSPTGGIEFSWPGKQNLEYRLVTENGGLKSVVDARGVTMYENIPAVQGVVCTDSKGAFSFELLLPDDLKSGNADIQILWPIDKSKGEHSTAKLNQTTHEYFKSAGDITIKIRQVSPPEPKVKLVSEKGDTSMVGQDAVISSFSFDSAGNPFSNAAIRWSIQPHVGQYKPPGWDEFRFHDTNYLKAHSYNSEFHESPREFVVTSDRAGKSEVKIAFNGSQADRPTIYHCEAAIDGKAKGQLSNWLDILVHPADRYVGIKMRPEATKKDQIDLRVVATDIQGKIRPDTKVKLKITEHVDSEVRKVVHRIVTVDRDPAQIFYAPNRDTTTVTCLAEVRDSRGRPNQCSVDFSPKGDLCTKFDDYRGFDNHATRLSLSADRANYQPGETARIEIKNPGQNSKGMLLVIKDAVVREIPLGIDGPINEVQIPITEELCPSVKLHAYLAHGHEYGSEGSIKLSVPPTTKRLVVCISPHYPAEAAEKKASVDVSVKDTSGNAVPECQLILAVVDEAKWIAGFNKWPDPLSAFYPNIWAHFFSPYVSSTHSRSGKTSFTFTDFNMGVVGPLLGEIPSSYQWPRVLGVAPENRLTNEFSGDTAFGPMVMTDSKGEAHVTLDLPSHATKYRIIGAAAALNKFGLLEASLSPRSH